MHRIALQRSFTPLGLCLMALCAGRFFGVCRVGGSPSRYRRCRTPGESDFSCAHLTYVFISARFVFVVVAVSLFPRLARNEIEISFKSLFRLAAFSSYEHERARARAHPHTQTAQKVAFAIRAFGLNATTCNRRYRTSKRC